MLVDLDEAVAVDFHPGLRQVQIAGVGLDPGRQQQLVGGQLRHSGRQGAPPLDSTTATDGNHFLPAPFANAVEGHANVRLNTLGLQAALELLAYLRLLPGQYPVHGLQHRDPGAEVGEIQAQGGPPPTTIIDWRSSSSSMAVTLFSHLTRSIPGTGRGLVDEPVATSTWSASKTSPLAAT